MNDVRGFTLLETLVALAIVAVALTASLNALGRSAQSAATLREHVLADWVAQNRLAELRATARWPAVGRSEGRTEQAGETFIWRELVSNTPNAWFRRVDVEVFDAAGQRRLTSLTGFATRAAQ